MKDNFNFLDLQRNLSTAFQTNSFEKMHEMRAKEKAERSLGAKAQIKSSKILDEQRKEIEVMRASIDALLKHSLERSSQEMIATLEREKIENIRFGENLFLTKVAALTGVVGVIIGAISIVLQFLK